MRLQGRIDRPWRLFTIVIVVLIAVLFFFDWRAFDAATRQVNEAREFVGQTNSVLSSIKDAETGERGYLLTGDPRYLAPYRAALQALPGQLWDLTNTADGAHRNQEPVERICALIEQRLAELKHAIELRDREGGEAAMALMRSGGSQLTMDEVRTACQSLTSSEAASMYDRARASERIANRSRAVVLAGCLALAVLLFRLGAATDKVVKEREQFAITVEESRQLLQTTFASIGDAVMVCDSGERIRFMNPIAESLTGWSAADADRRRVDEVFRVINEKTRRPESPAPALPRNGKEHGADEGWVLFSRSGQEIVIDHSSAPIRDIRGNTLGLVMVFRDITRRRAAERELERWKEIFSGAGFGLFVIDPASGSIVDMNPTFAAMHGYSVQELQGKPLACLGAESERKLKEAIDRAGADGRCMFENTNRRRDGSTFAALIDMSRFFDRGREFRAGYCADVTERRKFEDAVRDSEERFRTLANVLPQMIWSTDAEGRTEYVNEGWTAYAGWPSADGTGGLPSDPWDRLLDAEDRDFFLGRWRESLATGNVFEAQARMQRAEDGSSRWFLCRAVAVRDRNGSIVRWLGACTDVQQQVESSSQLRRANEALRRSNADLEQFAYAASHDLQEPLRMVAIYSELLKEEYRPSLDERAASYLDFAIHGAQRMSSLLKALLTYSRVTQAVPEQQRRADSNAALAAALLNLAGTIQQTQPRITAGALPWVAAPEVQVSQLFQNLLGNAIKYRRDHYPGGGRLEIHIEAVRQPGNQWRFSVRDNGIGIEPEYLLEIFGLFKRLHGQTLEGTGIGLALCQKIVERAGGAIWAESKPGEGSTFYFTLPGMESWE